MKNVKITKGKQNYTGKGSVPFKAVSEAPKKTKASSTPGMGKGKSKGMGLAEFGGKFSGIY
tara:strand:+ start:38 stop:220 length:183 start_codon:yes stop_codon:yes gene_type:complete